MSVMPITDDNNMVENSINHTNHNHKVLYNGSMKM